MNTESSSNDAVSLVKVLNVYGSQPKALRIMFTKLAFEFRPPGAARRFKNTFIGGPRCQKIGQHYAKLSLDCIDIKKEICT